MVDFTGLRFLCFGSRTSREELIKNSYENLTKGNAWEFFKKSNYYKYLQNEPAKFRTENAIRYAQKFLSDMQDLNLIEPECFNQ